MEKIYPNLFIGNRQDAYVVLQSVSDTVLGAALDVSRLIPSRAWHRAKEIALTKISFVEGKMPPDKLRKAIEFIHEQRKTQKPVMVFCDDGKNTADMVCVAYLMYQKDMSWDEALIKVEEVRGTLSYTDKEKEAILKFINSKQPDKVEVGG